MLSHSSTRGLHVAENNTQRNDKDTSDPRDRQGRDGIVDHMNQRHDIRDPTIRRRDDKRTEGNHAGAKDFFHINVLHVVLLL